MTQNIDNLTLLIKRDTDFNYGSNYGHVTARFVRLNQNNKVRNITQNWETPFYYDGLTITSQQDDRTLDRTYGWAFRYKDAYSIDYKAVKKMAKTMSKIEKGMSKMVQEYGNPSEFSDYIVRIAKIMKVKTFAFDTDDRDNPSSYDDCDFQYETDIPSVKWRINDLVSKNADALKKRAA